MYERADGQALWRIDGPRTFFAGPLVYNAPHQHGAPVYLAGLYGRFRIRIGVAPWTSCRVAMIPAGVSHELRLDGEPLAVLYVEPGMAGVDPLVPLIRDSREIGGALLGARGEIETLRTLWEDRASLDWIDGALDDFVAFGQRRARRVPDPRIVHLVHRLAETDEEVLTAKDGAVGANLSVSRLQHLFTAEIGVPFRRYRAWLRMRRAIRAIVDGDSFTGAAHSAGFSDQAHFAHDFRRTFGAPASVSLAHVRRPERAARSMRPG